MSVSNTNTGVTITDKGITIPDVVDIRTQMVANYRAIWGQDLDASSYTPQGQLIDTETAVIDDKNAQLQFVLNQFDPEKNEGVWQEGIGKIYFITRQPARPTTVVCQVVGAVGTGIPAGSIVQDDNGVQYAINTPFVITSSSPMNLVFTCTTPGPIVCASGSINRIFTQVPGWDTVSNMDAGITGSSEETRIAFEKRRYESVAKNAHGNVDSVRGAVANVLGVLSVRIAENKTNLDSDDPQFIALHGTPWPGIVVHGHSMFISVAGGDPNEIAKAIWERIDGGCGQDGNTTVIYTYPSPAGVDTLQENITFNRPETVDGYVQVTIKSYSNTVGNVEELIKQTVLDAWNGNNGFSRVEIGETVYGLRFACPLAQLGGFEIISVLVARDAPVAFAELFETTLNELAVTTLQNVMVIVVED